MDDIIEIISSSDSDLDFEDSEGYDSETSTRILPHPGSTSDGRNEFGHGSVFNGSSSNHSPNNNGIQASNQNLKKDNGNSGQSPKINSRKEPSGSAVYGNYPSLANSGNNRGEMEDLSSGDEDELVILRSTSGRVLPQSVPPQPVLPLKTVPSQQYASSSDTTYRPSIVDERLNIADERLIYQAALEDLNQPKLEAELPEGLLSVPLLRHQKIALAWTLQKEMRSLHCLGGILADDQGLGKTISMIALIQMQKSLESKSKSENSHIQKAEALNLDDDDDGGNGGSGLNKVQEIGETSDPKPKPYPEARASTFSKKRPSAGTLVVCPASVLRQWARELDEKVANEAKLSVLVYHGGTRTKNPAELAKYDVVLTTYAIVTVEVPKQPLVNDEGEEKNEEKSSGFPTSKKRKNTYNANKKGKKGKKGIDSSTFDNSSGPLAKVGWSRVILDEAQTIKNHRTQVSRACCSLRAKRRWCLSGTPIQNSIDDLYSYFRFLKYEPYASYKSFCCTIKIPISRNSLHGYKKLQAVLRAVMLRRTKGTLIDGEPIINLPPKNISLAKEDFSSEERDFYTQLETASRSQFKAYAAAGTVRQNYASILLMLLRLRQACDHPLLVKGYNTGSGKASGAMAKKLPKNVVADLLRTLRDSAFCQSCNDTPEEPVVTTCRHVFCYQCVSEYLTGDDNTCPEPKCKTQLHPDAVYTKSSLRKCISDSTDEASSSSQLSGKASIMKNDYTSAKINAVLKILQTKCLANAPTPHQENNPPVEGPLKAIIFSQWTGMLNLVESSLNEFCIEYRRLDGTMSLVARDKAVKEFNTDPEITVMLMSLKAGNLGLNMVAACHVILLDLWWNPTTEDQAIDRAHRIGQTRPVTVTRITIKNTVEDRILLLQEEKRKMVASAFGEDQGGSSGARLTVEDLKYLFMI